jgi:hypothetical protein
MVLEEHEYSLNDILLPTEKTHITLLFGSVLLKHFAILITETSL